MTVEIAPPLPDELLFSTFARARHRLGFSASKFGEYVLGDKRYSVKPLFQHGLAWLANRLSETASWKFTPEELRDSHTMFPFVAPFLTVDQCTDFKAAVSYESKDRVRFVHIGRAFKATHARKVRWCKACRRDDLMQHGEATCRRIHQLPELHLCCLHRIPLVETNVSSLNGDYIPTPSDEVPAGIILAAKGDRLQNELVEQIKELVGQPYFYPGWKLFRKALAFQLQKLEPLVSTQSVERLLSEKFGKASAAAALTPAIGHRNWLWYFLNRTDIPIGPGQLAIICAAAGFRIGDILKSSREGRQVYHSWWACMSPTSGCKGRLTIREYVPEPDGRSARFTCPGCQAAYVRPLPLVENWDGSFLHCPEESHATSDHLYLVA